MKTLPEVRKKAGLSQQALAEYLDVSRSQVNMVEQGLRDLPKAAALKLGEIEKEIAGTDTKKKPLPATADDKTVKKIKDHHKRKMEDHLFKATVLKRRLAILQRSHEQADAKYNLIEGLSKKTSQAGKNKFDEHWFEYHDKKSRKKILKAAPSIQMLTLEIEVQLAYAAIHEKILNRFA